MQDVERHEVGEHRISEALEDVPGRAYGHWYRLRYGGGLSLKGLHETRDDLLDHVGARTVADPELTGAVARRALLTAAECALGELSLGCFPNGDFEVPFPLLHEELSSMDLSFGDAVDQAPTARTWLDAFALCVACGVVRERDRVIGLLLRNDYAPALRDGVPYSPLDSHSDPAELAEMDALCLYLAPAAGHLPRDWPDAPLRKPDAAGRAEAARRLDDFGVLTADQRLLRVLLDDDQPAFERALAGNLAGLRKGAGPDAPARSLFPVGTIALAALAVQVHGWRLGVTSAYLPQSLLHA
ncbi:immunity 49 family protein [Streptomyces sp. NBC_01343]|uniref:immunity 49 family protein n=1 Tax=Streptomyces sp. NBC_01343 TaxID=2903832 RepID=UPI002E0E15A7|nr:immunity 49 family protein [Streptomyces sp. NBC_01343]